MDKETLARMFGDVFTTCTVLTEETLAQYAELEMAGQEPNLQLPEVGAHLEECHDCADRYAELLALLQAETQGEVPPMSYRHSFDLRFLPAPESEPRESTPMPDLWLEITRQAKWVIEALLLPPPRLQAAPLGIRGPHPVLQRFRAERIDVHVSVLEGQKRGTRTVIGRLVPHDETSQLPGSLEVWLMRDKEIWAAPVEAHGVFTFEEVQPGEYSVGFKWNEQAVLVHGVKVT